MTAATMTSLRLAQYATAFRTLEASNRSFPLVAFLSASVSGRATITTQKWASPIPLQSQNRREAFSCSASGDDGKVVDVTDLAVRARLRLEPTEVEEYEKSISGILNWFSQLQSIDVSGVNPEIRPSHDEGSSGSPSALRADEAVEFEYRDAMLKQVPQFDGTYIRVPRILNE